MSRRIPTHRRAVLHGACSATLTMMAAPAAAGSAKAAELDGELIALLDEARRLCREWQRPTSTPPTYTEITARPPWDALIVQACAIPARTPEGMRAKAEAAHWWVLGDGLSACDRIHTPQERLAVSLVTDLLGRPGA
jgi:hypothetical protein